MTAKTNQKPAARQLPADLADVALIDAPTCAAAGAMKVSWWNNEVREGRAPQPVIRKPRCTRWRLTDVKAFWLKSAEIGAADSHTGELVLARAHKASRAAKAARAAGQ